MMGYYYNTSKDYGWLISRLHEGEAYVGYVTRDGNVDVTAFNMDQKGRMIIGTRMHIYAMAEKDAGQERRYREYLTELDAEIIIPNGRYED